VSQADGMFLVRAAFELRDGNRLRGFITPGFHETYLGVPSPHMFVGKRCFRFWGGMFGVPAATGLLLGPWERRKGGVSAKVQRGARARDRSCGRLGRRVLSRITGNPGRVLNKHPNAKEK